MKKLPDVMLVLLLLLVPLFLLGPRACSRWRWSVTLGGITTTWGCATWSHSQQRGRGTWRRPSGQKKAWQQQTQSSAELVAHRSRNSLKLGGYLYRGTRTLCQLIWILPEKAVFVGESAHFRLEHVRLSATARSERQQN